MGKDPYSTLGVPRDADDGAIKRAHRRMVKRVHPDNPDSGDRSAFDAAQRAYELLSDPVTRARVDRGEDVDGHNPDNGRAAVISLAVQAFMVAVQSGETRYVDMVAFARSSLEERLDAIVRKTEAMGRDLAKWQDAEKRLLHNSCGDAPDFLASALAAQLRDINIAIEAAKQDIERHQQAGKLLESYAYHCEDRPQRTDGFNFADWAAAAARPNADVLLRAMQRNSGLFK